jgi:Ca2+-binding EF-hand superfamily protein
MALLISIEKFIGVSIDVFLSIQITKKEWVKMLKDLDANGDGEVRIEQYI